VTEDGKVGIGHTTPENLLHVGSGTSTITKDRVNAVIASQTVDAGIAIAQRDNVNVLLQAAGSGGYIGTTSDHPLRLRTTNADRVAIDKDGKVGVGTLTPQGFQVVLPETSKPVTPNAGVTIAGGLDGNANIEVRNDGTGTPYIDFAQKTDSDYDARLRLTAPRKLAIEGADLDVKGEIRGKLWTSIEYEWSQYDKTAKKMTRSDRSVCFLTFVTGYFYGGGEVVEIKEQNGYWVLTGHSGQKDVRAKARCIGAPDDSW
jgi:hypothetical protein